MVVGVIDYGLCNLRSVSSAVSRLGHTPIVTNKADDLGKADKLILPGVGAFGDAMANLKKLGLIDPLSELVLQDKKPILGICLGSQLMTNESCEFGRHRGLGWIDASVLKIDRPGLRVPHVGWNELLQVKPSILFKGVNDKELFYFVHSYHIQCNDPSLVIGECEYGVKFTAAFNRKNIYGVQFHPEKSQRCGLNLLSNFLSDLGKEC